MRSDSLEADQFVDFLCIVFHPGKFLDPFIQAFYLVAELLQRGQILAQCFLHDGVLKFNITQPLPMLSRPAGVPVVNTHRV